MDRPFLVKSEDDAERAYQEASSTSELLKARMLECMRAAESVLQQRDRYRRRPNSVNRRDVVQAVLAHVTLDQLTASCLIKALAKTEHAQLSTETADWLLETQPCLAGTSLVLNAAISAAAMSTFKPDAALRFLHLRDSYGLPPCLEATNLAITACSHSGRIESALALLEGMREKGLVPTPYSVTMTLQAANYKRRGRHREALRAVACLPPGQPMPSAVVDAVLGTFEAAMHKAGSLDEVEAMFTELDSIHLSDFTRACNAVLKACASRGDWQLARSYFDHMTAQNVPADTETFSALILSCVKGQALGVALDIFEWLVSGREVGEPIPADITTYNTLIMACHQAGLLEKALEIASWVLNAGVPWDASTFTELVSTVEIAQLWDTKVVNSPFYQLSNFSDAKKQSGGGVVRPSNCSQSGADAVNRPHVPQPPRQSEFGSVSGHPGFGSLHSGMQASLAIREGLRLSTAGNALIAAPVARAPTPPMVPLAIFPDQLRPAPFDGLRMMYLDQLKELEQESLLAAVKLNDSSWAARTLTRGGAGARGKGAPSPFVSAAGAMHGQGAFTLSTGGRATRPCKPKLPRIIAPPMHVTLSPAPSFRQLSLDNVSRQRLEALNEAMIEGAPRKGSLTEAASPHGAYNSSGTEYPFSPLKSHKSVTLNSPTTASRHVTSSSMGSAPSPTAVAV